MVEDSRQEPERVRREHREGESPETLRLGDDSSEPEHVRAPADLSTVGPYKILSELGRGGQGTVYLAIDTRLQRRVALKVLTRVSGPSDELLLRFRREAEVASKIDDPGICTVFDAGVHDGIPYIAMRHVEGETLAQRIARARDRRESERAGNQDEAAAAPRREPGSPDMPRTSARDEVLRAVRLVEKAARALHAAHEAGVIHRDVKAQNIMVTERDEPVILDFGLARALEGSGPDLTVTGEIFGTPAYMSPEQLTPQRGPLDRRTDVWSLGVTLYECTTLVRPFEEPTRVALYQAILDQEPRNPRRLNPAIPADLKVVIDTTLAKDRDRRYQTALALADDLRAVVEIRPIAARPLSLPRRLLRWARREPALAALVLVLVLAAPTIAGLGGFLAWKLPDLRARDQQKRADAVERVLEDGYLELAEGRADAALRTLRRAVEMDPANPVALAGAALASLELNDMEGATRLVAGPSGKAPSGPALDRVRAEILRRSGKKAEAAAIPLRPMEKDLDHFLAGSLELSRGHDGDNRAYGRAVAALAQAVATAPHARALFHFELAHAVGHAVDAKLARSVALALRQQWPDSPAAWHWAGFALSDVDPDAAIEDYEQSLRLGASRPREGATSLRVASTRRIGDVLLRKGDLSGAMAQYRRVLEIVPDHAGAFEDLAHALKESGDIAGAIETLRRATSSVPRSASLHAALGSALFENGDRKGAVEEFEQAVALNPGADFSWAALTFTLAFQFRFSAALDSAKRGVSHNPDSGYAQIALAAACLMRRDYQGAIDATTKAFAVAPSMVHDFPNPHRNLESGGIPVQLLIGPLKQVVATDPEFALGHVFLGIAYRAAGSLPAAIEAFRRAVQKDDAIEWAHYNLGIALYDAGDYKGAVRALRRTLRIDPGFAWTSFHLGQALSKSGDVLGAIECFERALDLDPNLRVARMALGLALKAAGDPAGARAAFETLTRRRPMDPWAWNALAWFLAGPDADPDSSDIRAALDDAGRAATLSDRKEPLYLDTLAWALYRSARVSEAVSTEEAALALAAASNDDLRSTFSKHLAQFRAASSRPASGPSSQPSTK